MSWVNMMKRLSAISTPVTRYLFTSSLQSLIRNQIAMRRRQSGVDILLPIKPLLQLFVWSESHLFQMPECQLFCHPPTHAHTYMCIINNCTPTLCSVRNLLSVSTHQNVLRWHWAEHFLNANNVICCVWLSNELGNSFHFAYCTNMHTDTIAHKPTHCNYYFFTSQCLPQCKYILPYGVFCEMLNIFRPWSLPSKN